MKLLIIYPHWPPSNLAGVHRPRLVANYLSHFGWHPIVLTIEEKYYEEKPDWDLLKTISPDVEVIKTNAFPVYKPRLLGDIGLRGFWQLYKKASEIISQQQIDFIWIPIPSFYIALLGRGLYKKWKIPYGIDYIDPWVRDISSRRDWRHKLSNWLAQRLEPIAIKKASLISGVSYEYYKPVLQRNFKSPIHSSNSPTLQLPNSSIPLHLSFPYGFDPNDHQIKLMNINYPWENQARCKPIVYAGAFLPKSRRFAEALFASVRELKMKGTWDDDIRFFFLGTGGYHGESLKAIAKRFDVEVTVEEIRDRFPFLHILNFLSAAYAMLILGSTEKHYTASKTFQSLLSKRPVLAIMHEESDAIKIMKECKADQLVASYREGDTIEIMKGKIRIVIERLISKSLNWSPDLTALEPYSAKRNAELLVNKLNEIVHPQPSSEMPVTRVQINK